jgi:hypothetical protein
MSHVVVIGIMCWRRCQNQNLGHHVFLLWGLQLVSIFWILFCVFCSFVLLLWQKHTWKKKTMEAVGTTQDFKEFEIWKNCQASPLPPNLRKETCSSFASYDQYYKHPDPNFYALNWILKIGAIFAKIPCNSAYLILSWQNELKLF